MFYLLYILSLYFLLNAFVNCNASLKEKISNALKITDEELSRIFERWEIAKFPNFLRAVTMSHTSWEVLKLKFMFKILKANNEGKSKILISFMGSSVTAGHDSPFNLSFPILTGKYMEKAFAAVDIELISINSALGNNPCLPYDVCVRAFSGPEADIVHWEQQYNCGGDDGRKRVEFEQFIRQALSIPSQPVVVFSESITPNWDAKDCADKKKDNPIKISEEEKKLLVMIRENPIKVVTELNNRPSITNPWNAVKDTFRTYKMAGIQIWQHSAYESYKCHGPYVKDWACCAASWHPSLLGHEVRAAHYSYFWLLIFRDALTSLDSVNDYATMLTTVKKRMDSEHKYIPINPKFPSHYVDNLQCFTTFEPLADPKLSLFSLQISNGDNSPSFNKAIYEEFIDKELIRIKNRRGYKDFKYLLYGAKNQKLSLKIDIKSDGYSWICSPPGEWGVLPHGFKTFWSVNTTMFLTENVQDSSKFVFSKDSAKFMAYKNHLPKDTQNICVEFVDKIPIGSHVLTVIPVTKDKIMISYLLLP